MEAKLKKEKKQDLYFWLLFIGMYCSHDTILFGTTSNSIFVTIREIMPIAISGILLFKLISQKVQIKHFLCMACFVALPLVSCVVHSEPMGNYIYRSFIIIAAALYVLTDKKKQFFMHFNDIMCFLCIWSVATFAIANFVPALLKLFPTVTNYAGSSFTNTIFSTTSVSHTYEMARNQAIFREPGVNVVFIVYAFMSELIAVPKTRTKYIVVFAIAMATTLSTAGYIMFAALSIYIIFLSNKVKNKGLYITLIGVAIIVLIIQTDLLSADGAMFNKFQAGGNTYGSWFARLSSLTENFKIFLQNPVFGIGRYALYDTVLAEVDVYSAVDNTNTILIAFAAYGALFGLMSVVGIWKLCKGHTKKNLNALFFFIILFGAMSNEDMGQNIVYYILIFYGLFNVANAREDVQEEANVTEVAV